MRTFDRMLESVCRVAPRPRQPSFRLEAEGDQWRVFDAVKGGMLAPAAWAEDV
ncbi:MAG: hypothetical protein WCP55_20895 [Lentisphaerota bacterium]